MCNRGRTIDDSGEFKTATRRENDNYGELMRIAVSERGVPAIVATRELLKLHARLQRREDSYNG
jgi:hypothetical protein